MLYHLSLRELLRVKDNSTGNLRGFDKSRSVGNFKEESHKKSETKSVALHLAAAS